MFPIGRIEDKSVVTTSFRPGALLITRNGLSVRKRRNTRSTPNILLLLFRIKVIMISLLDIITINMSILFQPLRKYHSKQHLTKFVVDTVLEEKQSVR